MNIECPYLEAGRVVRFCNASATLLIPSMEKNEKYCTSEDHYRCSHLLGHVLRSGKAGARKGHGASSPGWAQK